MNVVLRKWVVPETLYVDKIAVLLFVPVNPILAQLFPFLMYFNDQIITNLCQQELVPPIDGPCIVGPKFRKVLKEVAVVIISFGYPRDICPVPIGVIFPGFDTTAVCIPGTVYPVEVFPDADVPVQGSHALQVGSVILTCPVVPDDVVK